MRSTLSYRPTRIRTKEYFTAIMLSSENLLILSRTINFLRGMSHVETRSNIQSEFKSQSYYQQEICIFAEIISLLIKKILKLGRMYRSTENKHMVHGCLCKTKINHIFQSAVAYQHYRTSSSTRLPSPAIQWEI